MTAQFTIEEMESLKRDELQEKQVKREKKLSRLVKQLAEDTTLHGFKQIHDNKGPRKYVWVIALVLAISLVTVLFRSTVEDYLNYKTYIETEYHEEIKSLPFPTVTLCFSDNFIDFKFKTFPGNVTPQQYKRVFNVIHMDKKIDKEDVALFEGLSISSYEELVRSFHLTLEDTVLHETSLIFNHDKHCSFSKQKCTINDLKLVWQINGGRSCLQFNHYIPDKESRQQTAIFSPFRVYLDVREKYNTEFFPPKMYRYMKMVLYVHPYGTPHEIYVGKSTNSVLMERLLIDPGTLHKFYMDCHEINHMTPPYGTCGKKVLNVVKYYPYSVNSCIMDCILQYILKKCACIRFDLKYAVDDEIPVCTVSQMVRCYISANQIARKESGKCINECPLHCQRYKFNINRESVPLPTHHDEEIEEYLGFGKKNHSRTEKYIKDQVMGVELKYRMMEKRTETYRQLVSLATLLATIGGSIGLGMGLSLLTVVEFCLFILDSIKIMILRKKLDRHAANDDA